MDKWGGFSLLLGALRYRVGRKYEIRTHFNRKSVAKKNVNAVKSVKQSLYVLVRSITMVRDMNKTGGDTNTGLRQLQEQLQKYINENSTK
jgi:hypothetical protein